MVTVMGSAVSRIADNSGCFKLSQIRKNSAAEPVLEWQVPHA